MEDSVEKTGGSNARFEHPVVAVGASAGGVEALKDFVEAIPADTSASFVILQHLAPDHDSQLADILSRASNLPVLEADKDMPVNSGHIYVITPDRYLTIVDHGLFVEPPTQPRGLRMPIDHFMKSLAETAGARSVGVILSGTGNDGTIGLQTIKGVGGVALAQDPQTALYEGMPRAAIEAGVVDRVADLGGLASTIVEIATRLQDGAINGDFSRKDMTSVLALLKARMGHDFAAYKGGTIGRRIRRRMNLLRFDTLKEYLDHLRANGDEMRHLFDDLLINVTCFFRDDHVWEAVSNKIIAPLLDSKVQEGEALRIWVPACSSGEEAYSIAMLVDEAVAAKDSAIDWQIFATDLDGDAIAQGREGYYRANIVDDLSSERLQRYLQKEAEGYRIRKHLRERVVFAQHNVLTDPPFSRLDLVSCRNLLIYLDNNHQRRLLETFHFALRENGFLLLGTSESSGSNSQEFATVDGKAHIYGRRAGRSLARLSPRVNSALAEGVADLPQRQRRERQSTLSNAVRKSLADRYTPAAVAVNEMGEIAYFHGPVRDFLEQPEGVPSHSIYDILPTPLRSRAREAVKAVSAGDSPEHRSARIRYPDRDASICIECVSIEADDQRLYLLTFIEEEDDRQGEADPGAGDDTGYVRHLENELAIVQEDLQTTVEELETSNEELKASHEEAVAANEELQSANEELETSREELQSLNEELVTVNNQLEEKISEVEKTSDDLRNLLTSTKLPVLFLDPQLKISGFTPSARDLVELRETDVGRPVTELAFKADDPTLIDDVQTTLGELITSEKEIRSVDDRTFLRRIHPYRTSDERIHGVVVTYADISQQADISARLAEREKQQSIIAELGQKGLAARELVPFLNELCATLRVAMDCDYAKVLQYDEGRKLFELVGGAGWKNGIVGEATVPDSVKSQAGFTLQQETVLVTDFAEERRFEPPRLLIDHEVVSGASCVIRIGGKPWGVLGLHDRKARQFREEDLLILQAAANVAAATIKQIQREIHRTREGLIMSLAIKTADMGVWQYDTQSHDVVWDERLREIMGVTGRREKPTADRFFDLIHDEDRDYVRRALADTAETGEPFSEEFRLTRLDGKTIWLIGRGERVEEDGRVTIVGINSDITDRKVAEEQNRFIMRELDHRVKNILSIILSIAKITGANAPDFQSFIASFDKRLHAMARTHSLLAETRWHGTDLETLVRDELGHSHDTGTISIEGPPVALTPAAAQNLSMALHELATNALKYGALSATAGKLVVTWQWIGGEGPATLDLRWTETGGPPVEKPSSKGFGSTVIERILSAQLGSKAEIEFAESGLRVRCKIPANRISSAADAKSGAGAPASTLPRVDLGPLKGARILVLDDEWLVAEQHTHSLLGAGVEVVGPYHALADARRAIKEREIDFAVLDYNIDGQSVEDLIVELDRREVPLLVVSGYGSELDLGTDRDEMSFLAKPVSPVAMLGRVAQLMKRHKESLNGQA